MGEPPLPEGSEVIFSLMFFTGGAFFSGLRGGSVTFFSVTGLTGGGVFSGLRGGSGLFSSLTGGVDSAGFPAWTGEVTSSGRGGSEDVSGVISAYPCFRYSERGLLLSKKRLPPQKSHLGCRLS